MRRTSRRSSIAQRIGRYIPYGLRVKFRQTKWRLRRVRRSLIGPIASWLEGKEQRAPGSRVIASAMPAERRSFRVLVPVASPDTAARLARIAATVARVREGEVMVVNVVLPGDEAASASETAVGVAATISGGELFDADVTAAKETASHLSRVPAVRNALDALEEAEVPHGFVLCASEDVGRTLRREARRQRTDLIIMGWGEPTSGYRKQVDNYGSVEAIEAERSALPVSLRAIIEYPATDVLVVAGSGDYVPSKIIVPTGIGGDSIRAVLVADALAKSSDEGTLTLLRVLPQDASLETVTERMKDLRSVIEELSITAEVSVVRADGFADQIVAIIEDGFYDGVVLSSLHETLGQSQLLGGIQLRIARECNVPVLVHHRSAGELTYAFQRLWKRLYAFTPTLNAAERERIEAEIWEDANPSIDFSVMMGLSAMIASFGLLLDSAAVIIGAMLVAPLMSAIIVVGLGVVEGEIRLIRGGLSATLRGVAIAIIVATLTGLVYTGSRSELPIEIMSRTRPQLLDLGVAVASGAAAAYALARSSVSAALPGVAIAAALVPPLSVVGIGIATRRPDVALGAFLLFTTNFIAIAAAGGITFLLLGFGPSGEEEAEREVLRRGMNTAGVLLIAVALLLGWITFDLVRDASLDRRLAEAFEQVGSSEEFTQFRPFEIVEHSYVESSDGTLQVSAVIRLRAELLTEFTYQVARSIQDQLGAALDRSVALNVEIVPTRILSAREPPTATATPRATVIATATAMASPTTSP